MSSNNNDTSGRKRSRWGSSNDAGGSRGPSAPTGGTSSSNTNTNSNPKKDVTVSDDEALQALLASAAPTVEKYKGITINSSSNSSNRNPNNHPNNNNNKRPRRDDDSNNFGGNRGRSDTGRRGNNNDKKNGPDYSYYSRDGKDNSHQRGDGDERRRRENDRKPGDLRPDVEPEEEEGPPVEKQKPNFGLSGALAQETGVGDLKFQEPPEARAPNTQWRLYVFKDDKPLETLHISKQSAYLFGRNTEFADIHIAHPSSSGQHAVLQYRALPGKEDGRLRCQPYLMDLESTNGSFINGVRIDSARYYQLKKGDVLKFGASTREYVLLTDNTTAIK